MPSALNIDVDLDAGVVVDFKTKALRPGDNDLDVSYDAVAFLCPKNEPTPTYNQNDGIPICKLRGVDRACEAACNCSLFC